MGRAALELIGQGGLGYSFDPLVANTENTFGDALKALMFVYPFPFILSLPRVLTCYDLCTL